MKNWFKRLFRRRPAVLMVGDKVVLFGGKEFMIVRARATETYGSTLVEMEMHDYESWMKEHTWDESDIR